MEMNRHTMQSEVGYSFSGLWKGKEGRGEGRRIERQREIQRQRERWEWGRREEPWQQLPLWGRDRKGKGERLRLEAEDQLASVDGGGSGCSLCLKGSGQTITPISNH